MPSYQSTSSNYDRDRTNDDAASLKSEKLGKMPKSNHFLLPALFLEIAILACLAVFAYYLRFTDVFDVFRRYYLCGNDAYNYPYADGEDSDNVTNKVSIYVNKYELYIISALLPPLTFILGEIIYKFCGPSSRKVISTLNDSFKIPLFVRRMFRFIGTFWLGYLITSILTDSIKLLSGTPRPYLRNAPEYDTYVAKISVTSTTDMWCYLIETDLTDPLRNALMSFPSFYATISAYAATFAICYVQVILDFHGNYFLRPIISASLAGMALLAGYTRWMLYYNGWEDILIGFIFGISIALYVCFGVLNGFKEHAVPEPSTSRYDGELVYGADDLEARPGFFRFLPRIRTNLTGPRRYYPYPGSVYGNNHALDQHTLGSNQAYLPPSATAFNQPNSDFQTDLHNTVQNFGKKVKTGPTAASNQSF